MWKGSLKEQERLYLEDEERVGQEDVYDHEHGLAQAGVQVVRGARLQTDKFRKETALQLMLDVCDVPFQNISAQASGFSQDIPGSSSKGFPGASRCLGRSCRFQLFEI